MRPQRCSYVHHRLDRHSQAKHLNQLRRIDYASCSSVGTCMPARNSVPLNLASIPNSNTPTTSDTHTVFWSRGSAVCERYMLKVLLFFLWNLLLLLPLHTCPLSCYRTWHISTFHPNHHPDHAAWPFGASDRGSISLLVLSLLLPPPQLCCPTLLVL
jgi:hypothetical protein